MAGDTRGTAEGGGIAKMKKALSATTMEHLVGEQTKSGIHKPAFALRKLLAVQKPIITVSMITEDLLKTGGDGKGIGEPGLEFAYHAAPDDIERLGLGDVFEAGPLWGVSLHLHRPLAKGDRTDIVLAYKRLDRDDEVPTRVAFGGWPDYYQAMVTAFGAGGKDE